MSATGSSRESARSTQIVGDPQPANIDLTAVQGHLDAVGSLLTAVVTPIDWGLRGQGTDAVLVWSNDRGRRHSETTT